MGRAEMCRGMKVMEEEVCIFFSYRLIVEMAPLLHRCLGKGVEKVQRTEPWNICARTAFTQRKQYMQYERIRDLLGVNLETKMRPVPVIWCGTKTWPRLWNYTEEMGVTGRFKHVFLMWPGCILDGKAVQRTQKGLGPQLRK